MRQSLIFILGFFLLWTNSLFAELPTQAIENSGKGIPESYDTYTTLLKENCDSSNKLWQKSKEWGTLVKPPTYPELNAATINAHIATVIAADSAGGTLASELDMNRIGNFTGLKTLEIARIEYRNAMDRIFACAVIDARIQVINDLQKKIQAKFPVPNNEILLQLQTEVKRLEALREPSSCTAPKNSDIPIETQIINSATLQFCHFNFYLLYLQDNLEKDNTRMMNIEKAIGTGNGTVTAQDTKTWAEQLQKRQNQVKDELARAANTLPRAVRTFQEMKTTYPIHVMFTIIYDDYLRLRENLNRYLNATSQLFEKMYNAQDANNK